ncbi:Dabb family protein [Rhodohalobacter mucosus]|uniref:Stress responsive protein n=1 Tax=Rhodohalobacter mucosus TaxID=2079485 RepID=A0A316TUK9_9BACT|nr:Dabb family protein [Rhodohalobacter mucosus]PWN06969.1 stress responsive protein [Rhodohalobacter mucosus]
MKPTTHLLILSSFILLSCNSGSGSAETDSTEEINTVIEETRQLRHVVLFEFTETSTTEDIERIEEAFAALPSQIDVIRDFEWGINNSPEGLDQGFTHCFIVTFDSEEGRDIYLPHPAHQAFVEILSPHLEDVLVVDYWAR